MNDYKTQMKKSKVLTCHNCTFYNIIAERHVNDTCDRFFIMKLHSVIYNQRSAEEYRPMLRMYVYVYLGFRTGQHLRSLAPVMNDF